MKFADSLLAHVTLPGVRDALVQVAERPLGNIKDAPSDELTLSLLKKASASDAVRLARFASSPVVLERLWADKRSTVRQAVSENPHLTDSLRERIFASGVGALDASTVMSVLASMQPYETGRFLLDHFETTKHSPLSLTRLAEAVAKEPGAFLDEALDLGNAELTSALLEIVIREETCPLQVVEAVYDACSSSLQDSFSQIALAAMLKRDDSLATQERLLEKYPQATTRALLGLALAGRSVVPIDEVLHFFRVSEFASYALGIYIPAAVEVTERVALELLRFPDDVTFPGKVTYAPEARTVLARHPNVSMRTRHLRYLADPRLLLEVLEVLETDGVSFRDLDLTSQQVCDLLEVGARISIVEKVAKQSLRHDLPLMVRRVLASEGSAGVYTGYALVPAIDVVAETMLRPDVSTVLDVNTVLARALEAGRLTGEDRCQAIRLLMPQNAYQWLLSEGPSYADVRLYLEEGLGLAEERRSVVESLLAESPEQAWHEEAVRSLAFSWGELAGVDVVARVVTEVLQEALGDNPGMWREVLDLLPGWDLSLDDLVTAARLTGIS